MWGELRVRYQKMEGMECLSTLVVEFYGFSAKAQLVDRRKYVLRKVDPSYMVGLSRVALWENARHIWNSLFLKSNVSGRRNFLYLKDSAFPTV